MDPSLKNLIPHEENVFPVKELLKVWGKGVFVELPAGFLFVWFFGLGFVCFVCLGVVLFCFVQRFLVFCKDEGVFWFFEMDSVLLVIRQLFPLFFSL